MTLSACILINKEVFTKYLNMRKVVIFTVILFLNVSMCKDFTIKILPPNEIKGKIVGGIPVPIEKYPFVVLLSNKGALCAGSILNSLSVVTAGHCFDFNEDVRDIAIHVGARHKFDHAAKMHRVSHVIIHENYNKEMRFSCDIAVVFVTNPFTFSDRVQRVLLVDNNKWMNEDETNFTVTGWGMIKYNGPMSELGLLMASLRFIPLEQCSNFHNMTLTQDMFCLYGDAKRDSCKGDSGGGVMWNSWLVGIVSHGHGCAGFNKPSVYTNVWYFRSWIQNVVENYFFSNCTNTLIDTKLKES